MKNIPQELSLEIINFLKTKDILSLKKSNKDINNLINKNNKFIFEKLLENLNYDLFENKASINIHKGTHTFSITKSKNIKTLADALKLSRLDDI
jgi:hypothetical protein